ncbi:hypothetical protein Bbelb_397080 [Branchiostoma belcheri]|nr:hypothetical protein Bbelb_397080 [Branchiostoma belcheri]
MGEVFLCCGEPVATIPVIEDERVQTADRADINTYETADLAGAWVAATDDQDQWLMRDLGVVSVITGIITKGRDYSPDWPWGIHDQYVTSYVISYGDEDGDGMFYTNAEGQVTVFPGNDDRDTEVINDFGDFSGPITARFIKIHPPTRHGHIAMRAKMVTECPAGWSLFSGKCYKVFTDAMTYSQARQVCIDNGGSLAMIKNSEINSFVKTLPSDHKWFGLTDEVTEGQFLWEDGSSLTSTGFTDWYPGEPNGGSLENCVQYWRQTWNDRSCTDQLGFTCEAQLVVNMPKMGKDVAMPEADRADINTYETADLAGAWVAATDDQDQWLMRDLGVVSVITGIITKGRDYSPDWPWGIHDQYVTSYVISYGDEDGDGMFYTNAEGQVTVFPGNDDRDTEVINDFGDFSGPITARFIKIHPRTWHGHIAMRAKMVTECPAGWSLFSGKCYKVFTDAMTYSQARQVCIDNGGSLAMIKNSEINSFVKTLPSDHKWFGLTDEVTEGQFLWEDGSSLTSTGFTDWYPGEPNGGSLENCVQYWRQTWNDRSCTDQLGFTCEALVVNMPKMGKDVAMPEGGWQITMKRGDKKML